MPPALSGRLASPPVGPLVPPVPSQLRPLPPPAPSSEAPSKQAPTFPSAPRERSPLPAAVIRLFEEERARAVETAKSQVATAAARAAQATEEAKKAWALVRAGALAQFKADQADAAAKAAVSEKGQAERVLAEAQERERNARRDVEDAFRAAALAPFVPIALEKPAVVFRPVPFTYRLSVLGAKPIAVKVENGTLGRELPTDRGEGGAWIMRCADATRVRVKVGSTDAEVVVRSLPEASPAVRT